jgi:oligoribonuclease
VIHQSDVLLERMDAWNKGTHGQERADRQGEAVRAHGAAGRATAAGLRAAMFVPRNASPLCGNTISQDRRFLVNYMPRLEAYFHYRNLDVSTLKELAKRWRPDLPVPSRSSRSTRHWPMCTSRSTNWCTTARTF